MERAGVSVKTTAEEKATINLHRNPFAKPNNYKLLPWTNTKGWFQRRSQIKYAFVLA